MKLWTSLTGLIQAELLTADPAGALCAIADAGIALRDVTPEGELCLRFSVARPSYGRLLRLTRRRGETLTILGRTGLYWRFRALAGRPVLLAGLALLLCAQILIPTRIFFVRVSGNQRVPARQILAAAESCGLRFGANRRALRSEAIKNSLLSAIPELKWAGVNTSGCVAVISVAEKQPAVPAEPAQTGVASVIAARDGVIKSLLCTRGTPLVKPGQAVTKGQVLISGYTDCGKTVLAQRAQGEIMAYTHRDFQVYAPKYCFQKAGEAKIIRRWSLILGKKRIKLWFGSGILGMECGRMYREYPLTLPGGFVLPVRMAVDCYKVCELSEQGLPEESAYTQMQHFARTYLPGAMTAGTVLDASETFAPEEGAYVLSGSYSCLESIGRSRREETGETNEQGS